MDSNFRGRILIEGFRMYLAKDNIRPMTEAAVSWRKLHNGELHNFYSSASVNYGYEI
jgi:hypothetical protein